MMVMVPFSRVGVRHGKGNSLAFLVGFENDELARLGLFGYQRGFDFIKNHCPFSHFFAFHNLKHFSLQV